MWQAVRLEPSLLEACASSPSVVVAMLPAIPPAWLSQTAYTSVTDRILRFVEQHEYLALFSLLFLEEVGIPLPVPGDAIMAFAGYLADQGRMNAALALLSLETGTMAGASTLYWAARLAGRPFLLRHGRHAGLDRRGRP